METLNFVALDFETAKGKMPCQLGLAVVENGVIIDKRSFLIQPPNNEYSPRNVYVHNIWPKDTANEKSFDQLWAEISPFLLHRKLVAHNASFDYSVILAACEYYDIDTYGLSRPECTCIMHNKSRLEDCCAAYGIDLENHHDGLSDAVACAELYIMRKTKGIKDVYSEPKNEVIDYRKLSRITKILNSNEGVKAYGSLFEEPVEALCHKSPFFKKTVCFTGEFDNKSIILDIRKKHGIIVVPKPTRSTHCLVVGINPDHDVLDQWLILQHDGYSVPRLSERDFLDNSKKGNSEYSLSIPIKKVDIDFNFIFNNDVYIKNISMPKEGVKHFLGGKEIYIRKDDRLNMDALAQCLGNIGAIVSYELSDSIDYIWLTDECVSLLRKGAKSMHILDVENYYNNSNSPKFQYKFLVEKDVFDFIERRSIEIQDVYSEKLFSLIRK